MTTPFQTPAAVVSGLDDDELHYAELGGLDPGRRNKLSPAEIDVLTLAALGKTNQEIADARGGQTGTVKVQLTTAYRKLGVRNRSQAIFAALRAGLLTDRLCNRAEELESDLGWLLPHATHHRWSRGKVVFRVGDKAESIFLILRGHVALPELGQVLVARDLFGEAEDFSELAKRQYSAICETDVDLFEVKTAKARELSICEPGFGLQLIKLFVRRLRAGDGRLIPSASEAA